MDLKTDLCILQIIHLWPKNIGAPYDSQTKKPKLITPNVLYDIDVCILADKLLCRHMCIAHHEFTIVYLRWL